MINKPYISADQSIPEMTWIALLLGALLSVVLGAANMYLGLYAGMTVSASIPAAVISMGVLRGILRRGTILENNIVQTMASTGESLAAGIIFTLPAMVIAGVWVDFDFWTVTLVALLGGILGIIYMIPMRRSLIIEDTTLKYPEGTACAEVLTSGEGERSGLRDIVIGMFVGGILKFFISAVGLVKGTVEGAFRLANTSFYAGSDVSAALIGVGVIVGYNIGMLMFIGGALGWLIGIPLLGLFSGGYEGSPLDFAWDLWSTRIRYMGVGAMIVAGIWSIFKIRHGILAGFHEVIGAFKKHDDHAIARTDLNMATGHLGIIFTLTAIGVGLFAWKLSSSISISLLSIIVVMVLAFFLVAVASYICGLVGSSNSPVSGMTICALLCTASLFYLLGISGTFAIMMTLLISGIICCATCTSGDISQDLKTGYLVGATPRKQQWAEIIGTIVPIFFFAPILTLLHHAYGIGTNAPGSLKAPQAALFASLTKAIFGEETMPWDMITVGALLAISLVAADAYLENRGSTFRLYPMPVAVGIYLPFSLSIPILIGGLIERTIRKFHHKTSFTAPNHDSGKGTRIAVLLSSGLIAGEAMMGILVALMIALLSYTGSSVSLPIEIPFPAWVQTILSLGVLAMIVTLIVKKTRTE